MMSPRTSNVLLFISALFVLLGVAIIVVSFFWLRTEIRHSLDPKVRSYNGTTWEGDTCHVDADGVLWCTQSA